MGFKLIQENESRGNGAFARFLTLRNRKKGVKMVNESPKRKKWWKRGRKETEIEASTFHGIGSVYKADISILTALTIWFAMGILLLIIREVAFTTRDCAKWEFWTLLATGSRNAVLQTVRSVGFKALQWLQ